MATRATIYVDGIDTVKVYKHWDGYPKATLPWLCAFNKAFTKERGDNPDYKFAQLLRSSAFDSVKYKLDASAYTGWGVVDISDDVGEEHEYHLLADGTVKHLPVERHCETALEAENAKLREHLERLTGLEIQLRDKIRELKKSK